MNRIVLAIVFSAFGVGGCRDRAPASASAAASGASTPSAPVVSSSLALSFVQRDGRWEARDESDSALRMIVAPRTDDRMTSRLCAHIVTRSVAAVAMPFTLPIDTTMPPLAIRLIDGDSVSGLRYLVPGAQGFYVFEGVSHDGSRRISMRWPVISDPTRPIPATAPDSLIESAISPSPYMLDSAVRALRAGTGPSTGAFGDMVSVDSARAMAMPLVRDLPDQNLLLSDACAQVTIALPMLARVDQKLRLPVLAGDRVSARALPGEGAVQLSFDEAPPPAVMPAARQSITDASFTSRDSGRVTLRVRLQVVPRVQQAEQTVVLSIVRARAK